jgi:hypothetical protein
MLEVVDKKNLPDKKRLPNSLHGAAGDIQAHLVLQGCGSTQIA